ncbi:MAG: phosphoadenosine phosphosulfate reductase family protein, partial [Anaerolineae bacterium]|nr:phosphoadenosine phosphosulfate reductase family protein [Anaerolineae bacterium]
MLLEKEQPGCVEGASYYQMRTEEKELYRLHALLNAHRKKTQVANDLIHVALTQCQRPYLSCSFGKDSVVMLHLVYQQKQNIDVIWIRCDEFDEWPGTEDLSRQYQKLFPHIRIHPIWSEMSITDCYRRAGCFYTAPENEQQERLDREYGAAFMRAIRAVTKQLDADCAFIGLREDESQRRAIMLRTRGWFFNASSRGLYECFPLAGWSSTDIWAYIVQHNLPCLPLYDLLPDRELARNGTMFAGCHGGAATYRGQLALIKRAYPELYAK